MQNLFNEIIECLKEHNLTWADVQWVGTNQYTFSIGHFRNIALDINYNNEYGIQEINPNLKIVGSDWWLERHEYDGSEWWEFKTMPIKPSYNIIPLEKNIYEDFILR